MVVAGIEQAKYTVQELRAGFEVREYAPAIVAETRMPTLSREDTGAAFRAIAGYIFGGNERKDSIAMTAPVVMDSAARSEKIAMTAPVVMGGGTMQFVMPSKYKSVGDLPKPTDSRVTLREVPARRIAALRFSWYATPDRVAAKMAELTQLIERDGLTAVSRPYLASYDPPFSVPFLKRHDILVDLAR
jgi:SOUL heme-binding protein